MSWYCIVKMDKMCVGHLVYVCAWALQTHAWTEMLMWMKKKTVNDWFCLGLTYKMHNCWNRAKPYRTVLNNKRFFFCYFTTNNNGYNITKDPLFTKHPTTTMFCGKYNHRDKSKCTFRMNAFYCLISHGWFVCELFLNSLIRICCDTAYACSFIYSLSFIHNLDTP